MAAADKILYRGRFAEAFWNIGSFLSLVTNMVLLIVVLILAQQLFTLKGLVAQQLVGGLHSNFVKMDAAHIRTHIQVVDTIRVVDTIQVADTIPVVFDLPLHQATQVVLVKDTPIKNATIYLNGQAVPLNLVLRKGTPLSIQLDLTVPVSQTVPVNLTVPVQMDVPVNLDVPIDIPLNQTELHDPFIGLQDVVAPYDQMLAQAPDSWFETPLCRPGFAWLCTWLLAAE